MLPFQKKEKQTPPSKKNFFLINKAAEIVSGRQQH